MHCVELDVLIDIELKMLALAHIAHPMQAQAGQRTHDRLTLRIENLGFGNNVNDHSRHACRGYLSSSLRMAGDRERRTHQGRQPVVVSAPDGSLIKLVRLLRWGSHQGKKIAAVTDDATHDRQITQKVTQHRRELHSTGNRQSRQAEC